MPAISVVAIILAAVVAGGTALVATHGKETQQFIQKMAGTAQQQLTTTVFPPSSPSTNATKVSQPPQSNQSKLIVNNSSSLTTSLLIESAQLYVHLPSHVTIKNNGTDSILVHQVSYGQYSVLTGDFILPAGKQEQINMTGITLNSGSSYILEVSGKGAKTGNAVLASQIIGLQEPLTKIEIVNASIYIAKVQYPTLSMTLHNAGMDSISIKGIKLGKQISSELWAHGNKAITLLPNETTALNLQLDSYDYMNDTVQQAQGMTTYILPTTGSSTTIQIVGQSSTGHSVSVSASVPVKNDYKPVVQIATATIKIENVMIKVNPTNGHSTVTMTFRNNSTHPVVLRSVSFSGANVPVTHWSIPGNFVINISTTNTLSLTDPASISMSDIGHWVIITATGQFYSGSEIDNGTTEGTMVYSNTIAQVTT